jgi:uncharacterized protein YyaL (SSP411 family)
MFGIKLKFIKLFADFYDVTEKGNWEEKTILRILKNSENFASEKGISITELEDVLHKCRQKLLAERNKRIRPVTDDKILLGWNALMITALCKAAAALNKEWYTGIAVKTMDFILQKFRKNNNGFEFLHTYKNGNVKYPAFLDDYAYLIQACIQLQEITSSTQYLDIAKQITLFVIDNFMDEETSYFFFTHKNQADIILRKKEVYDGATASGNSIMAENLFYLSVVFDTTEWYAIAEKNTTAIATNVVRYPTSFGIWASLLLKYSFGVNELAIIGNNFMNLRSQLLQLYMPGKILQAGAKENQKFPILNRKSAENETLIFLCRQYSCKTPVSSIEKLMYQTEQNDKF